MGKARAGAEYDPMQVEIDGDVSFVVVVGGVCSSLGKGVTASGIGAILRAQGVPCTAAIHQRDSAAWRLTRGRRTRAVRRARRTATSCSRIFRR